MAWVVLPPNTSMSTSDHSVNLPCPPSGERCDRRGVLFNEKPYRPALRQESALTAKRPHAGFNRESGEGR